ncbi:MAG: putative Ig domain-containing protein [Sedimenticola sp.]
MIELNKFSDMAAMAEASYVKFDRIYGTNTNYSDRDDLVYILDKNTDEDFEGEFSVTQAEAFASKWIVIHHQKNTESGFSATLFKNGSGEYVLGIRGSEFSWYPFNNTDLLSTGINDIAIDGLAIHQIVDLYNYWQQLTAAKGSVYKVKTLETQSSLTADYNKARLGQVTSTGESAEDFLKKFHARNDVIIDNEPNGKIVRQVTEVNSDTLYGDERRTGLGISGLVSGKVDVTGHSLGGHLATAFTRLFPSLNSTAYSINGAGFATGNIPGVGGDAKLNISNLFSSLGGADSFKSNNILNLFGDKYPEIVSQDSHNGLKQQGDHQPVFIESVDINNVFGHGGEQMTDALAVYELFIALDIGLQNSSPKDALNKLLNIMKATSYNDNRTYEDALNVLGNLFDPNWIRVTKIDRRENLYSGIKRIKENARYNQLQGSVSIEDLSKLEYQNAILNKALASIEFRYALLHLNPFILSGAGTKSLYDQHNTNGELDVFDQNTGKGELSENYLADRAKLLFLVLNDNANYDNDDFNRYTTEFDIDVPHTAKDFTNVIEISNPSLATNIVFGSDNGGFVKGSVYDDHLYGSARDDFITAKDGDDYLEGGKGNDKLDGGKGDDIYYYKVGDGVDTIIDSDGIGSLKINGSEFVVTGTPKSYFKDGNLYWKDDAGYIFSLDSKRNLSITGGILTQDDKIVIESFEVDANPLGIQLSTTNKLALITSGEVSPFATSTGSLHQRATTVAEGGSSSIKVVLNRFASQGDKIIISAAGADPASLSLITGNDTINMGSGPVELDLREGQSEVSFAITNTADLDAVTTYVLTAIWQPISQERASASSSYKYIIHGADETDFSFKTYKTIEGGSGDDVIEDTIANDAIYAGRGDDTVHLYSGGHDYVELGSGNDALMSYGHSVNNIDSRVIAKGGSGNDGLIGGSNPDILEGGTGSDTVAGGGGDDLLYGNERGITSDLIRLGESQQGTGLKGDNLDGFSGDDLIFGGAGDDRVAGGQGNDLIVTGGGDDWIWGDMTAVSIDSERRIVWESPDSLDDTSSAIGDDVIYAGSGNDMVNAEGGDDTVYLGSGDDVAYGDQGNDVILGGQGNDELIGGNIDAGHDGDDFLDGGIGDDVLYGGGGKDTLYGGAGNDQMSGDGDADDNPAYSDADYMDGEAGDDVLIGRGGGDVIYGGEGNDEIHGDDSNTAYQGDDFADGESGNDLIYGDGGSDTLLGGDGDDKVYGDSYKIADKFHGNDRLEGGSGSDELWGMGGSDVLYGGSGADTLSGDNGESVNHQYHGHDYLDGGLDDDLLVGDGGSDELVGGDGDDQLHGDSLGTPFEYHGDDQLSGNNGNDSLLGYGGNDTLLGGEGDDNLTGDNLETSGANHGNDLLDGGSGNDNLIGQGADDTLLGGQGDDELYGDESSLDGEYHGADRLDGGSGNDYLVGQGSSDTLVGGQGNDNLFGDASYLDAQYHGDDILDGGSGADRLHGQGGDDTLLGGGDDDVLAGDASYIDVIFHGDDYLDGGNGNDALVGHGGNDTLHGGSGDDELFGDSSQIYGLNHGSDSLDGGDGNDYLVGHGGSDTLIGGSGDDKISGDASSTADIFHGDDWIDGGSGNDNLSGQGGNDYLSGGDENDEINGGSGDDFVDGGRGDDSLYGGSGSDTFILNYGDGRDIIHDADGNDVVQFIGVSASDISIQIVNGSEGQAYQHIKYGDQDVLYVNNGFVGSIKSYMFSDGTYSARELIARYLSDPIVYRMEDSGSVYGGSNSDTLVGSVFEDEIYGHGGDDVFAGGKGDDVIFGGSGNDVYKIGIGTGKDIIHDPEDKSGTIHLLPGVVIEDLFYERHGDDLYLHIDDYRDGVVIKDFYGHDHIWNIEDEEGGELTISSDHLPDTGVIDIIGTVDAAKEDFCWRFESFYNGQMYVSGFKRQPDGAYQKSVTEEMVGSHYDRVIKKYIYNAELVESYLTGDGESVARNLSDTSITYSDPRAEEKEETVLGRLGGKFIKFGSGSGSGSSNYKIVDVEDLPFNSEISGIPISNLVPVYSQDSTYDALSGYHTQKLEGYMYYEGGVPSLQSYSQRVLYNFKEIKTSINIETIEGNDLDNLIQSGAGSFNKIDGGAGDDLLDARQRRYEFERFIYIDPPSIKIYGDVDLSLAPGSFLFGNTGDDKLLGGQLSDTLVGGEGDDLLMGGMGGDTYRIIESSGHDTIYDDGWDLPGYITEDVVVLPEDIGFSDLMIAANETLMEGIYTYSDKWWNRLQFVHSSVTLSWSDTGGVTIIIPPTGKTGSGIEYIQTKDGTKSLSELLNDHNVSYYVDPHLDNNSIVGKGDLYGGDGDDVIISNDSEYSRIIGGYGKDELVGGDGNDQLYGGEIDIFHEEGSMVMGNYWDNGNTYRGGPGYDIIWSTAGSDVFVFQLGDQEDIITDIYHDFYLNSRYDITLGKSIHYRYQPDEAIDDWYLRDVEDLAAVDKDHYQALHSGQDILRFGVGIKESDISVLNSFNSLIFSHSNNGDAVIFENYFGSIVNQLSRVEFSNGAYWNLDDINSLLNGGKVNLAPIVQNEIPDQTVTGNGEFTFKLPEDSFIDLDSDGPITYAADLADGGPLPDWLSFDSTTQTFNGIADSSQLDDIEIRIRASDDKGKAGSTVFNLIFEIGNSDPTVAEALEDQRATEDTAFNFTIPDTTFSDVDNGDLLSLTVTQQDGSPLPGWLSFDAATRTLSGRPLNGDVGTLSIRVTATDQAGASVHDAFTLTIDNTNDAPTVDTALEDQSATEDTAFSFTIPDTTFSDVDNGDLLSLTVTQQDGSSLPSWLSFDAATRTLSGTPLNGDVGTLSLKVNATDLAGATISDDLTLTINNTNDAPTVTAALEDQSATEDTAFSFTIPDTSFSDVDVGDQLSLTVTQQDGSPLPGWLSFDVASRTLSGTPLNRDVGTLSLKVTATDLAGASVHDEFSLTIDNTNDAPIVSTQIADQQATEDTAFNFTIPEGTFSDVDASDLLSLMVTQQDGSPLPSWLSFDVATRTLSGTPLNADVGTLSLKVSAADLAGASVHDVFTLTVDNTNDAPTVTTDLEDQVATEDTAFNFTLPEGTFSDVDAGDLLSLTVTRQDGSPLPSWLSFDVATRTLSGTPLNADVGTLSLKVSAADLAGASVHDVFTLTVDNTNDAPTVTTDLEDQVATEDTAFNFTLPEGTFSDVDAGDLLSLTVTQQDGTPLPGWLSFDAPTRTLSGTPLNGDVGTLSIRVTVTDQAGASVHDAFTLTIDNTNDAPTVAVTLEDQSATEDTAFSFTLPEGMFSDVDAGDLPSLSITQSDGSPLPGWLSFDAPTRTLSGTPLNGDVGTLSIRVTATDQAGASVHDAFTLTIDNTNDAPTVAVTLEDQSATEDTAFNFTIPDTTFSDVDNGDLLSLTVTQQDGTPLPGWLTFDASTRTLSGTPLNGDVGTLSLKVSATDLAGASVHDAFTLTIDNTNDAPTVETALTDQSATEDATFSFTIPEGTFRDVDAGDQLSLRVTQQDGSSLPDWLTFDAATRTLSGTPTIRDYGSQNIVVTAIDKGGLSISDSFQLTVDRDPDNSGRSIKGTRRNNWLWGTRKDDTFTVTDGNDRMFGLSGDDVFIVNGMNDGYDRIYGGGGFDIIKGGVGDDTINLRSWHGVERIDGGGGYNVIQSGFYQNYSNVELVDIDEIRGSNHTNIIYGSSGADKINGGGGNDILNGRTGDDTISGDAGNDVLIGGEGNDTYRFSLNGRQDTIINSDHSSSSIDVLEFSDLSPEDLWFSQNNADLVINVIGTNDKVTIKDWYISESAKVDVITANDLALQENQISQLVNAMAVFDVQLGDGDIIPRDIQDELAPILTSGWQ